VGSCMGSVGRYCDVRSDTLTRHRCGLVVQALMNCVRWPLLTVLVIIEPLVRFALAALALLLVLTSVFLECVSSRPIPFLGMLATAVGCVALLSLYQALIRALS
jgi:hypothetical protein